MVGVPEYQMARLLNTSDFPDALAVQGSALPARRPMHAWAPVGLPDTLMALFLVCPIPSWPFLGPSRIYPIPSWPPVGLPDALMAAFSGLPNTLVVPLFQFANGQRGRQMTEGWLPDGH